MPDEIEYGRKEWKKDSDAAYAEAECRVAHVLETGETYLFLSDLYALKRLPPTLAECVQLERLHIGDSYGPDGYSYSYPGTHELEGWSVLSSLKSLTELVLTYTNIADISPLEGATALQSLNLWNTQVADISPLEGATALQTLDLAGTQVADISPLEGATALQSLN
ncbi:MAG: leucine-rich repeat domain-containing protein, partial [Pseudomonadota bacterium]